MCRYAMYGPYKDIYACFQCKKIFKQASDRELSKHDVQNRTYKCPQCGGTMNDMGYDFKAPKLNDCSNWNITILHA